MSKAYLVFNGAGILGILTKKDLQKFKEQRDMKYFDILKKDEDEAYEMLAHKDLGQLMPTDVFDDMIMFPDEEIEFVEYMSCEATRLMMRTGDSINNILEYMKFDEDEERLLKVAMGTTLNILAMLSDSDLDFYEGFDSRKMAVRFLQSYGYDAHLLKG